MLTVYMLKIINITDARQSTCVLRLVHAGSFINSAFIEPYITCEIGIYQ